MNVRRTARRWGVLLILLACSIAAPAAQQAAGPKKPITHAAYDSWRSIQGTKLSRDGTWLAYALVAQEGDGELVVRNLQSGSELRQPRGTNPLITPDGKFVAFSIAPLRADVDKAKKDKKKPEDMPKPGLGILDLASGKAFTVDRVKSFKVAEESGRFIAYLLEAEKGAKEDKKDEAKPEEKKDGPKKKEKKKEPGTTLVIRELSSGAETRVTEVTEYVWNKSGDWLAYAVSSKKPEVDGAFVRKTADGTSKAILSGAGNYKGLVFDEGAQLALVSDRGDYKSDAPRYGLYHWSPAKEGAVELGAPPVDATGSPVTDPAKTSMPAGWAVSEFGKPEFSKDGQRLFFGVAPAPRLDPEDAPDPVKVDVWTWKDPELQPMQKVRADEERKRTYRAVIHLANSRMTVLGSPDVPDVRTNADGTTAVAQSNVPYRQLVSWDGDYADFYLLNLADASRRKVIERAHFGATLSPTGKYLLYFDYKDASWYVVRTSDGSVIRLTDKLGVRFDDETSNTPEPPRPWGVAGWTDNDASVLVYDRFDIWELRPEGGAPRMITNGTGRKQHIVFRYQRVEPDDRPRTGRADPETIHTDKPLLLLATDDRTKASGFFKVTLPPPPPAPVPVKGKKPARAASTSQAAPAPLADPVKLVMMDKLLGGVVKAKDVDRLVFTAQRFDEFPNLWVTDLSFATPRKVSDANPQQANYLWGRSELVDYINADGLPLRAILTKPENFDPSKKYPLMVYIYEELTDGLHRYVAPGPGTSINVTRFVSNGYIVLQPDIVYSTGYPGQSALKCVLPAVQRVVSMGFIDQARIGIQGHSWGGYQITYLVTQTDMFKAVQAGASVSNMVSAYGGIRWGTGMSRAFQYERTQSRIGGPPWSNPLQFIENSPIFWVEKVKTPYLTIHNDDDDAVPWYQGIEFFSALRRLGKEAYMFVYNGEKHGLRERGNQKHWTVHQCEFFDHYLLGAPRPEWMDKGVPYLEKGKRDVMGLFK